MEIYRVTTAGRIPVDPSRIGNVLRRLTRRGGLDANGRDFALVSMLKYPGSRIGVIGSGHFGLDLLHHTRPTARCRERHGREAPPASRFSPAVYVPAET